MSISDLLGSDEQKPDEPLGEIVPDDECLEPRVMRTRRVATRFSRLSRLPISDLEAAAALHRRSPICQFMLSVCNEDVASSALTEISALQHRRQASDQMLSEFHPWLGRLKLDAVKPKGPVLPKAKQLSDPFGISRIMLPEGPQQHETGP